MDTEVTQAFQRIGQFARSERTAVVPMGDIAVLAVDATEGAAGKENRAGSARAGDGRFLPEVRGSARNEHLISEAAKTGAFGTVGTAFSRAEGTVGEGIIHHFISH